MNNIKKIILSVKLNDKVTILIDQMNVTVHRFVGYAEKSNNPVYKDSYYGTFAMALNSLLDEDILSEADKEEMTVREYLELENKCRETLTNDIRELLKGDTLSSYRIIEEAKKLCTNCDGPDIDKEEGEYEDDEE